MKYIVQLLIVFCIFIFNPAFSTEIQDAIVNGKQEFIDSCSICHGASDTGDGEFATMLTIPVADLTTLSENNDGNFPFYEVYQTVDGRDQIRSHQLMNMPMWGDRFSTVVSRSADPRAPFRQLFPRDSVIGTSAVSLKTKGCQLRTSLVSSANG